MFRPGNPVDDARRGEGGMEVMTARTEGLEDLTVHMRRNGIGVIQSVDESIYDLLGWRPDQMIGNSSTTFIHPDDQSSAIAAWVKMLDSPDGSGLWRGRYQS